ncbi:unnamed protein product [Cyprideis torosa]|uniref:Uncharacterized protein n=1 Tax=Cyprideis torosa TaxID=163714 RepID=A0A7R8ZKX4_9CRUS|nr:unnamed protein product [Cyprideis torosa]CAG0885343.1 unnamed protein product [Cyprideis torosa]
MGIGREQLFDSAALDEEAVKTCPGRYRCRPPSPLSRVPVPRIRLPHLPICTLMHFRRMKARKGHGRKEEIEPNQNGTSPDCGAVLLQAERKVDSNQRAGTGRKGDNKKKGRKLTALTGEHLRESFVVPAHGPRVPTDPLKRGDWTPLMCASARDSADSLAVVKLLLEASADVTLKNKDGWTPIHLACRTGFEELLQLLLDAVPAEKFQSVLHDRTNNGRTILHIMALHNNSERMSCLFPEPLLLQLATITDSCGHTPLDDAVAAGAKESERCLK